MRMREAVNSILGKPKGFRISFEWRLGDGLLRSDHFPDRDEELIPVEEIAWRYAELFAQAMNGKAVNVYVVDEHFSPVLGYREREIRKYPPAERFRLTLTANTERAAISIRALRKRLKKAKRWMRHFARINKK